MAAADYRLLTEATGQRIAEALEAVTAMVGPKGDPGDVSEAELTAKLADKADVIVDTASGAIASFPDGMAAPAKDLTIDIEPVQSGSGDPSPDNVRPISGWTGANVTRCGKNLISGYTANRAIDGNGDIKSDGSALISSLIKVKPNTSYVLSGEKEGVKLFHKFGKNMEYLSYTIIPDTGIANIPSDCYYIYLQFNKAGEGSVLPVNGQFEEGTVATTYEPYTGTTIPISWQSVAGTVYGGTLDVTTGLLTMDRAMTIYNTASGFSAYSSGRWYKGVLPPNFDSATSVRNTFLSNQRIHVDNMLTPGPYMEYGSAGVYLNKLTESETLTDLENMLSENPIQVVYRLATPQTYQLTPTEVEMLLGENNVWADTGDSTVTYRADTKLYIQKINTPTDDDMIADAQIASGRYFIVGGNLYKSTTTIPAGDAINPGSNCILTNLADALNALNT